MKLQQVFHDHIPYDTQNDDGEGENNPLNLLTLYRISHTSVAVNLRSGNTDKQNDERQGVKWSRPVTWIKERIGKKY